MSQATNKAPESKGAVRGKLPAMPEDGALYKVTKATHFIHGRQYDPGEKVFFNGKPGKLLEPLNDAARKAAAEAAADRQKKAEAKAAAHAEKAAGKK